LRRLRLYERNQLFTGRSVNRFGNHPILESQNDSSVQENPLKNRGGGKEPGQLPGMEQSYINNCLSIIWAESDLRRRSTAQPSEISGTDRSIISQVDSQR